jgi:hypothetical protein
MLALPRGLRGCPNQRSPIAGGGAIAVAPHGERDDRLRSDRLPPTGAPPAADAPVQARAEMHVP